MPQTRTAGAAEPAWWRTLRWMAAIAVLSPAALFAVLPEPERVEDKNPGSASSYRPYLPTGSFWVDAEPVALAGRWIFHAAGSSTPTMAPWARSIHWSSRP